MFAQFPRFSQSDRISPTLTAHSVGMSKRKSEEPHDSLTSGSPVSKKARVEDVIDESLPLQQQGNGIIDERSSGTVVDNDDVEEEEEDDDGGKAGNFLHKQKTPAQGYSDLYLDTIHRSVLDFDFEKLCSVSLSNINVYACLVCGRYFQGRGPKSHAYFHALDEDHHVYINMETKKVYVLPEGYEVQNKSLEDIKYVVDPRFSQDEVMKLDKVPVECTDLSNKRYRPGYIGMNNIKANDYLNVVVQTLAHIPPMRNFFLLHQFPSNSAQLAVRLSTLVRKIWNPKAFRNHVSPHELIQEIALRSSKRFNLTQQSDPVDFLAWFLNQLHVGLGGSKTKPGSSVVQKTFQGRLRIETQAITARSEASGDRLRFEESSEIQTRVTPFMILTLDLPPVPLFRDSVESKNIIPQVALTTLLQKYNGYQASEKAEQRLRHRLLHPLPPYLIFHVKRFSSNKFVSERNPTIVTFTSPRNLDLTSLVEPNPAIHDPHEPLLYDLVSNIVLDTTTGGGGEESNAADAANKAVSGSSERIHWKVQVRDKAAAGVQTLPEWREIQDLYVERAEAETLFTRESYLMVWERRGKLKPAANGLGAPATTRGKQKA